MAWYLLRRLAASVVVLLGVSILIFGVARVIPGDPARIVASGELAARDLAWEMRNTLDDMVASALQSWSSSATYRPT